MAMVIERRLKVLRGRTKRVHKNKVYEYDYGVINIKLPRESIGKEVRVIVVIPE